MNKAVQAFLKENKDAREFHCSVCGKLGCIPMVGSHLVLVCEKCSTINDITVEGESYTVRVRNRRWQVASAN